MKSRVIGPTDCPHSAGAQSAITKVRYSIMKCGKERKGRLTACPY